MAETGLTEKKSVIMMSTTTKPGTASRFFSFTDQDRVYPHGQIGGRCFPFYRINTVCMHLTFSASASRKNRN